MAKSSRQFSPSAAPSGARGRRELSRRCLSPPGRVSTRPVERGWSEGNGASRRCGRGRFFGYFLVATRKSLARRGETRPIIANRRHPENRTAKTKSPGPRPSPGRRILSGGRASSSGTARRRQWRSRAGGAFPFCSAECSPRPAGIVASMSEPARASFDATRRARVERGHRLSRRCGRGRFFGDFLVATRKSLARRGETRPIIANRKHPKTKRQRSKALDPGLRRGDESCPAAVPETKASDAQ